MSSDKYAKNLALSAADESVPQPASIVKASKLYANGKPISHDYLGENRYTTQRAGYIPKHEQILNLLSAGVSLDAYRAAMYTNERFPDDELPVSMVGRRYQTEMDVADAARELNARLEKQVNDYNDRLKRTQKVAEDEAETASKEKSDDSVREDS